MTASNDRVVSSIREVPVTQERKPFLSPKDSELQNAGTARANLAPSSETPSGTTSRGWATKHAHQTVLQQHCDFFDRDHDGIIWPRDTFIGFHRLGFNILLCLISVLVIHANFSYPTCPGWLPDPFFRLFLNNIHRDKHGSDTGTYDTEGRFVPQHFENIFAKYAQGRGYLTVRDVARVWNGQRCIADPIGWGGAFFEWTATYIMLWPEDGRMMKEDIRGVYDGSIFYTIAARREKKQ
ncbi:Caleosin-domain-containing protein [Dothidotthia symphoricarpi CBS 119687]|uniref:Caleosin-domain-containing protein n=1 Tax=Dothidotthia symphoricarpi CBS 119687 TaxID=1392245 RepID=A0A6A6AS21_9PLEO|nr:Caleosin-domain-containing protein [Dothidotthia symphoricarpi CBS 119687]KAF2134792.1 Caleosin-domain-containing protein [Dothidotthia symphoricarpi CBS 119687]